MAALACVSAFQLFRDVFRSRQVSHFCALLQPSQRIAAPWLSTSAINDMLAMIKVWAKEGRPKFCSHPQAIQKTFISCQIASFVQNSNILEQTSEPYSRDTYQRLIDYALTGEPSSSEGFVVEWDSEGEVSGAGDDAIIAQARAHVNAVRLLFPKDRQILPSAVAELTTDKLCQLHQAMFEGSVANGQTWLIGEFRHENLCAGGYDFRQVENKEEMHGHVKSILNHLQDAMMTDQEGLVIAAWFTNAFLMLHPFQNGNGRIARLLFAFIVSACHGIAFPTVLSAGGSQARKRYISALKRMQQRVPSNSQWLMAIALQSVHRSITCVKDFTILIEGGEDSLSTCQRVVAHCRKANWEEGC